MPCPLVADCLNEVYEYLEEDKATLHSCLLVNRLWCKVSVMILWRNIWNFIHSFDSDYVKSKFRVASEILGTLIACLPNDSEELLHKEKIFIQKPTSKPPMFNYPTLCKVLSINEIAKLIYFVLEHKHLIDQLDLENTQQRDFTLDYTLVVKEIIKMFMNQIYSLKTLNYYTKSIVDHVSIPSFTYFPDFLTNLSELSCSSDIDDIDSEFFYRLSQICHNLQSLTIVIRRKISNGLKELISSQNNLKKLNLLAHTENSWTDIIAALTKHSNTLTRLHLDSRMDFKPLSFVSLFLNLREIIFTFESLSDLEDFEKLQYITFPKLQFLKIHCRFPYQSEKSNPHVMKFLEINGKNLKEFYTEYNNLSLTIANFCPNLKKLVVNFHDDELDTLETIFNCCQHLESIRIYRVCSLSRVLEAVAKHSPKTFYELEIFGFCISGLTQVDLESFFVSWDNRIPKKTLSLIFVRFAYYNYGYNSSEKKIIKIIEKYTNLGIVKYKIKKRIEEEKDRDENHYFAEEIEYKLQEEIRVCKYK